ncbi:MAG TPA: alpha/beta hydrolase-fold protein [Thermoanaerobaculia bacterium]|nr:alpha/beta hydrolase-fold protein [Thermoanaerobaculia bacterium]
MTEGSLSDSPPVAVRVVPDLPAELRALDHRPRGRRRRTNGAAVEALLARRQVPLRDGARATFLYRGAAESVHLRHWVFGLEPEPAFRHLDGTDLWALTLELPEDSRVEYKLAVVEGGEERVILDPLNPRRAHDPFGANSVLRMPGYERPEWTRPDPAAPRGRLEEVAVASAAFDEERRLRVYVPAAPPPPAGYSLLVAHDGEDYRRFSDLRPVLDNLISAGGLAPLVVALHQPGSERLVEYAGDPRHARFVADELVPVLEERYPVATEPARRGLAGASFGAVAALATAWLRPGRFGRLLLQSGSFAADTRRGEVFVPVADFMRRFREAPRRPAERIFVSCGVYESLVIENRALVPDLEATGARVRYRELRDGHHWEGWRDAWGEGLPWLFPREGT